jgi:transposase
MIGNGHEFRCGRQFAAWLGLTPGQYSSGGKTRLGRITKAGDAYLRTMLILGAHGLGDARARRGLQAACVVNSQYPTPLIKKKSQTDSSTA